MNQSSNHDHLVIHEKVTNGYHRDFTYTELWLFESVIIFVRSCWHEILKYFSQMKNLKVNFQRCKGKPRPWLHQYSLPRHATTNSLRRSISSLRFTRTCFFYSILVESSSSPVLFTHLQNHWQFWSQRLMNETIGSISRTNFQTFPNCEFITVADDSSVHEIGVYQSYKEAPRISCPVSAKHLIMWNNIHWSASWCEMAW